MSGEKLVHVNFGKQARERLYNLDKSIAHLNHGSYGVTPTHLLKKRMELIEQQEKSPDKWFRSDSFDMWTRSLTSLAKFLRLDDAKHLVLCRNATDAVNCVVKSLSFREDNIEEEVILASQYTYLSVRNVLDYTSKYRLDDDDPIKIFRVPITYPIASEEQIIEEYDKMCKHLVNEKRYRIRLAMLDHISSETATLFPIKKIIQTIRKWSQHTTIMVDGAHAIGQVEIKLDEYECDFYCSNLHKWFLAPRGCAFLYIRDLEWAENNLQPNVVTNGYGKSLTENFFDRNTCDQSSFYLVDDCIRFYVDYLGGLDRIGKYNEALVEEAAKMLALEWKTSRLEMPSECQAPFMRLVQLPPLRDFKLEDKKPDLKELLNFIYDKYKVSTQIFIIQNQLYCRLSCYIYNEPNDFIALKDTILDMKV